MVSTQVRQSEKCGQIAYSHGVKTRLDIRDW